MKHAFKVVVAAAAAVAALALQAEAAPVAHAPFRAAYACPAAHSHGLKREFCKCHHCYDFCAAERRMERERRLVEARRREMERRRAMLRCCR